MSRLCSLIRSYINLPVSPTFAGILVNYPILSIWVTGYLGRTKSDLSVVSDLKTVRTPCCSKQR